MLHAVPNLALSASLQRRQCTAARNDCSLTLYKDTKHLQKTLSPTIPWGIGSCVPG